MSKTTERLIRVEAAVRPDWIDFNGHMRDAYFMLVVSWANDALMEASGLGPAYLSRTGCTLYNLENHVRFLKEAHEGDALRVEMRVLDCDAKRVHLFAEVSRPADGATLALNEAVLLHVSQRGERVRAAEMPGETRAWLEAAKAEAARMAAPAMRAGPIGLVRR
ncbi:MAG: thioesterase family protein [Paracoccaceae bacterium]